MKSLSQYTAKHTNQNVRDDNNNNSSKKRQSRFVFASTQFTVYLHLKMYERDRNQNTSQTKQQQHQILHDNCLFWFPDFGWLLNYSIYTSFSFRNVFEATRCAFQRWNQWVMNVVGGVTATLLLQASPLGLVFCHVHEIQWSRISNEKKKSVEKSRKNNVHWTWFNKNIFLCLFRMSSSSSWSLFSTLHCIAIEGTHSETHWPYIHAIWYRFYTNTHSHSSSISFYGCAFFPLLSNVWISMHMHDFTPYTYILCWNAAIAASPPCLSIYSIVLIHSKSQSSHGVAKMHRNDEGKEEERQRESECARNIARKIESF